MILEAVTIGILVGQYIYHRWEDSNKPKSNAKVRADIPRSEEGAAIPYIFGRVRVRSPVIAWAGNAASNTFDFGEDGERRLYRMDMFLVLGIPFTDGTNSMHNMWAEDKKFDWTDSSPPQTGNGGYEDPIIVVFSDEETYMGTMLSFFNGNSSQTMFDTGTTTPTNEAAFRMSESGTVSLIPGFRGYMAVLLFQEGGSFYYGINETPPAFSFEVSSYPTTFLLHDRITDGVDANPADVIREILVGRLGKLGLDTSLVDDVSFYAAAVTLNTERHGYSRAMDQASEAGEVIAEVLKQIDGILYEDPTDGKIKIKLVRNDYTEFNTLEVNPDNCRKLTRSAGGGNEGRVNKVRVTFTNRDYNYTDGSSVAQNQVTASTQDGGSEEVTLNMPGIHDQALADTVAGRELSALSRPLLKCHAEVDRSFLRVRPGDVVRLRWPKWNVGVDGTMFMRVVNVSQGNLEDGAIRLDLLQDFYDGPLFVAFDGVPA